MTAEDVWSDLQGYEDGYLGPDTLIEKYGLVVGKTDSIGEAILLKFASHVTASLQQEIGDADTDCGKALEQVASLTKEREELKQMIVIVAAEGDAQLTETGKAVAKWQKAESRVEELEKALREIDHITFDALHHGYDLRYLAEKVGKISGKALKGETSPKIL